MPVILDHNAEQFLLNWYTWVRIAKYEYKERGLARI